VSNLILQQSLGLSRRKPWETEEETPEPIATVDPGPFPSALLDVPGIISEIINHNFATAFKRQPVLALAAAIVLVATITGRRVR
jgi:hypothetical protein